MEKLGDHRICKERVRSSAQEISSVETVALKKTKGGVKEVRATPGWEPGWERVRVQIDSGAMDTAGPKDTAKAFEMKNGDVKKRLRICGSEREQYQELRTE